MLAGRCVLGPGVSRWQTLERHRGEFDARIADLARRVAFHLNMPRAGNAVPEAAISAARSAF